VAEPKSFLIALFGGRDQIFSGTLLKTGILLMMFLPSLLKILKLRKLLRELPRPKSQS